MKKTYTKPEIVFEDFSLNTSITAGCTWDTGLHSKETSCGYQFGREGVIFVEEVSGCIYQRPDGYNDICYHNPSENSDIFNS